ncbi:unnamed protein product [Mesocestoides corti]|uniref:Cell cycle checkpoint control protein RAD9A n=1 Tax=Mesocestoides corti TaxID=53468 RepID=A0A0R3UG39_MESCO|nr:unnamed protein product [Mesocestoides corti]
MKLTFLIPELKVFTRAVSALGKLGDELYFECSPHEFSLRCVNSSRSAFAVVFFSECFFEKASGLTEVALRFKLSAKTCCKIFKQTTAWVKVVQKCKMRLDENNDRLIVQFFQRHGIVKTYNLPIIECESLEAVYNVEDATSQMTISSKVVGEILSNFRPNQTEVTMVLQEGECVFQNYVADSDFSAILTHVPISSSEFDIYRLGEECDLTFCLKDFRAAVAFGESMNSIVSVHCSRPGKPLVLTCTDNNRFKAHFVLASLPSAHTPKQPPVHPISNTSSHFKSMNTVSATPSSSRVKKSNLQSSDTALMAPTQVLQSSETGIARTHFEARSVLFSRSGGEDAEDTFFRNPPPAQPAVPLCEDLFENVDMDVSFSAAQCDTDARSNCRPSSTRLIDAKAAATSGWDNADSLRALAVADADCGRKSNATLLVADSDEEG